MTNPKKEQFFCQWEFCRSPIVRRRWANHIPKYCAQHRLAGRLLELRLSSRKRQERLKREKAQILAEHNRNLLMAYSNPLVRKLDSILTGKEYEELLYDDAQKEGMIQQVISELEYREETL